MRKSQKRPRKGFVRVTGPGGYDKAYTASSVKGLRMLKETPPSDAAVRKVMREAKQPKCDVCHDGVISCAEGGMIVKKVCVFCRGRG